MKLLHLHQRDFRDVRHEASLLLTALGVFIGVAVGIYLYTSLPA